MDTCNSKKSHSTFTKRYEGSENQVADLAITLHPFLKMWMRKHPNYDYTMNVNHTQLTLTVKKQQI